MKTLKKFQIYFFGLIIGSFLISCTHDREELIPIDNSDQIAYDKASAVVGSQLYNDFTVTPGFDGPKDPTVNIADITSYKDFYRCKQCHAWDLKARYGSYINRGPKVGRPDISKVKLNNLSLADITELFDKIKNTSGAPVNVTRTSDGTNPSLGGNNHPDYGTILTDAQIWDLVKFLREGAFNVDELFATNTTGTYPTGSVAFTNIGFDGNTTLGQTYFTNKCSSCHGADGNAINLGGYSVGEFVRKKPYELQHKVVSGQVGTIMAPTPTSLEEIKGMLKLMANDPISFPDRQ
ncbi:MAG: hypothetical protein GW772_05640 [Flavobacteriia bacterium]|nr:hypothetical protein [Flavobacteriia bacterium]OIP45689.1 MAG: hypothetical protein AUK46_11240 [Flavobacteriaceae bacterium CG2_30_31_66]PIV97125.1 MAG: hypothetical protein COW43_04515 [Flavobacteriaceae bacterium CG17_big_fil_post_rev_8_21_14_2_50_31_13]PIX11429.1 MAG: hypothetical protein COZ74_14050 [Flavobacteriaceae bacterium CG_4_8_14_3_um_filter_31_8]PIY14844.1 MAG: hypothetical protein COZ16_06870 [Flavobacteriaceae bacterium CG_4_10_14_3_um_filter_31_253]PIZ09571.1 MAG: hypotheti